MCHAFASHCHSVATFLPRVGSFRLGLPLGRVMLSGPASFVGRMSAHAIPVRAVLAFDDQQIRAVADEPAIAAALGAGVLLVVAGLALRWCLNWRARLRRTCAAPRERSERVARRVPASAVRAAQLA